MVRQTFWGVYLAALPTFEIPFSTLFKTLFFAAAERSYYICACSQYSGFVPKNLARRKAIDVVIR
ncbi:MAG: hypothetical protein LBU82_06955, partial [Treponema sp.]|nr:hypothetical protein [Treponema sp.]